MIFRESWRKPAGLLNISALDQGDAPVARASGRDVPRKSDKDRSGEAAALVRKIRTACAPVETSQAAMAYFRGRGITTMPPSDVVAFLPGGLVRGVARPLHDALVVWAVDEYGTVTGGQRILIDQDGKPMSGDPRKPSFGQTGGSAAKLPGKVEDGPLIVAEGPETALSVWQATGMETWSVLGVAGFKSVTLPTDRKVIFCPDQDAPRSPAADAFDKAVRFHANYGVDLWIARAPESEGSKRDLNDTLQRAGEAAVVEAIKTAVRFTSRDARGRFTGPGAVPVDAAARPPEFLAPDVARDRIREAVSGHLDKVLHGETADNDPPPVLAIAATPGAGKSTIVREVLAGLDLSGLPADIVFYFPTLALAEEAAAHARGLGLDVHVMRGRSARDPASGQPMCSRADLAELVAEAGQNVRVSLCECRKGGQVVRCPHAEGCAYRKQWADLPARPVLRFETSARLPLRGEGSERPVCLRIIDETIWRTLTVTIDLSFETWTRPRPAGRGRSKAAKEKALKEAVDTTKAAGEVLAALQAGNSPVLTRYTAEDYEAFENAETGPNWLPIDPGQADERIYDTLKQSTALDRDAARRAAVWRVLADCRRRDLKVTERLRIARAGDGRDVLRVHWFEAPPRDAPVLLLDADATPEIVERLYPGAELLRLDLKPNAEILQLSDRTFSYETLGRPEARRDAVALVQSEVYRDSLNGGRGVLVVASRKVVRAIFEDAGYAFDGMTEAENSQVMRDTELHGARWLWFGPASLGRNDWGGFGTVVVIGREELPLEALQDMARGFWGDSDAPLELVEARDGQALLPEALLRVTMADGSGRVIRARAHPDPRVRALQLQTREFATRQSVERLRLVNASPRKRVILACKVPVPGLPVDRLLTWDELAPTRLQTAIVEGAQAGGVLRLSAAGLAADAPKTFATPKAADEWLRKGGRDEIKYPPTANNISIGGGRVFEPVLARLRVAGQRGRATPALIVLPGNPEELATAQLGPLDMFELVDGAGDDLHGEIEAPSAAASRNAGQERDTAGSPAGEAMAGTQGARVDPAARPMAKGRRPAAMMCRRLSSKARKETASAPGARAVQQVSPPARGPPLS